MVSRTCKRWAPAARTLPVYRAAPKVAQTNLPPFPAAIARRADVKACGEEQGDFNPDARPEAVARLSQTEYLWSVPCGQGAYNYSALYIVAGKDGSNARRPGFGEDDTLVNGGFDPDTRIFGAFNKGRGPGDCGQQDEFVWDGRAFRPIRRIEMNDCRGVPWDDWLVTWRAQAR